MNGQQLREFRKQTLQMSAEKLAEALGVRGNSVVRWERGDLKMPPYLELAVRYLEVKNGRRKK
jgi:DNA-binding XRE family transcriptional regulator